MSTFDYERRGARRPEPAAPQQPMDIPLERPRRRRGWMLWLVLFAVVATVLVWLFSEITSSLKLSIALVGMMLVYMAVMGWLTSKNLEKPGGVKGEGEWRP